MAKQRQLNRKPRNAASRAGHIPGNIAKNQVTENTMKQEAWLDKSRLD
ncbi:MAG: hypothetical protein JW871_04225 [Endomicrobiales bacterium]|nr:hypothetical protein [Endomicrobiales bacterium]